MAGARDEADEFLAELDAELDRPGRSMARHPVVADILAGRLSRGQLKSWVAQQYLFSRTVPKLLALRYAQVTDPAVLAHLRHVMDEELAGKQTGTDHHVRLHMKAALGLGMTEAELAFFAMGYTWESSSVDCSIDEPVDLTLPAGFAYEAGGLQWNGHRPAWEANREIVAQHRSTGRWRGHSALMVRVDWLTKLLRENGWGLFITLDSERLVQLGGDSGDVVRVSFGGSASFDGKRWRESRLKQNENQD